MLLSKFENLFNFKSATCCFYWTRRPPGVSILPQMMVMRVIIHTNTLCIITQQHEISTLNPIKNKKKHNSSAYYFLL